MCKHICKHGVNIGMRWCKHRCIHVVNIGVNMGMNIQKEHFVCIILCEIFILTLLCHTYIFQHFVCIMLCEIFILTLSCDTYIFLHFVCIIHCEIFILTLLCHTYIFLSYMLSFLSSSNLWENVERQFYWKVARNKGKSRVK